MSKDTDVADLLGDAKPAKKTAAPAKKAPTKTAAAKTAAAPAAKKAPAKTAEKAPAAKKAAPAKAPAEKREPSVKAPVHFAEGERAEIAGRVKKSVKKDINSRELAEKLGVPTKKLRVVLYGMKAKGDITLTPGASKVAGMTVSPA